MSISVPLSVQEKARQGLVLRKKYGRGGTEVGEKTARKLLSGKVSEEFAIHVSEYFPRHEGDRLDKKDPPSNGWIAWLLWGGDEGRRWSERIRDMASQARKGVRGGYVHNPSKITKLNSHYDLGEFNGYVYKIYYHSDGIYGVPLKKVGAWGDSKVRYDDRLEWGRAREIKVGNTRVINVSWAGGTEEYVVYSTDILELLEEKKTKSATKKGSKEHSRYKGYLYARVSTPWGTKYVASKDVEKLTEDDADFVGKTKEVVFKKIDEYGDVNSNPSPSFDDAVEVTRGFHGREPEKVITIDEIYRDRKNLATIGELEELVVMYEEGEFIPIEFDPDVEEPVMVCATPDRGQILLVGGDQGIDEGELELEEEERNKDYIELGRLFSITYWADKHHLVGSSGKREAYEHEFDGETEEGKKIPIERRVLPMLMYDRFNEKLVIVGGRYVVKDEGIAG